MEENELASDTGPCCPHCFVPIHVGAQWELPALWRRRNQSHSLGFFLTPGAWTGILSERRLR